MLLTVAAMLTIGFHPAHAQSAASAAAQASPALVGALSKELAATPEQAAGAAGALFGLAQSRLSPGDFSKVSGAVPGMDLLLKAAPVPSAPAGAGGLAGGLSQLAGSAGALAPVASAFSKLGLKPEQVAAAIPVVTSFVTKSGGASVGNLLAGVFK
jgi:hypothetical protein